MRQKIVHGAIVDAATPDELAEILEAVQQLDTDIVFIDTDSPNAQRQYLEHFPVPTHARVIVPRRPSGGQIAVDQNGQILVPANKARLGGQLTNIGANPAFIYLGTSYDPGAGTGWLASGGGNWDFEISDKLWAGAVFAQCAAGLTTTITVIDL